MSIDAALAQAFLATSLARFESLKQLGDGALAQVSAPQLFVRPGPGQNSIAILVQHLHGNMLSRWTDFLTSDGEKPSRTRDAEFEPGVLDPVRLLQLWQEGWQCTFAALRALRPQDVAATVHIRGEPLTVMDALIRQVAHYGYHVGQIVQLARTQVGAAFRSLSIARGQSAQYAPQARAGGRKE